MRIVIDIHDEEYKKIINSLEDCGLHRLAKAIAKGKQLPKGHGDLIDRKKLLDNIDVKILYHQKKLPVILRCFYYWINNQNPIIEADEQD